MVLFLSCRQSEHASNLRELAHRQLRCHANAPTTERLCREGAQGPVDLGYARTETKWRWARSTACTSKNAPGTAERSIIMEVRNVNGHYEIYLDGAFVCSCDANELREVVEEMGE